MSSVAAAGPAMARGAEEGQGAGAATSRVRSLSLLDAPVRGWDREAVAREAAGLEARTLDRRRPRQGDAAEVPAATRLPGGGLDEPAKVIAAAVAR